MGNTTYFNNLATGWDPHDYGGDFTFFTSGFNPVSHQWVTRLGWYRSETGFPSPTAISLHHQSSQGRVFRVDTPTDDGTVGWQWTDCPPVQIPNGGSFAVALSAPNGCKIAERGATPPPFPDEGFGRSNALLSWRVSGLDEWITGGSSLSPIYALDVELSTTPPASVSGISAADVHTELERFLTASGDSYAGTPLADTKTVVEEIYNETQDASHGLAKISSNLDTLLTRWSAALATKLDGAADQIGTLVASYTSALATSLTEGMARLAELWSDILACFGSTPGSLLCIVHAYLKFLRFTPQLADTPEWELVDEIDFTDNLLWPVEADVYRVTLSVFDPAGTSEPVGTETRHAYLGKWCPFNVQFSQEWHYFNTPNADLVLGGRMPGLGLILYRPGAGHVQAWRRVEAP